MIDQRCYELAYAFLEHHEHIDTIERAEKLAEEIQNFINSFIQGELDNYEPKETGDAWTGGFAENH